VPHAQPISWRSIGTMRRLLAVSLVTALVAACTSTTVSPLPPSSPPATIIPASATPSGPPVTTPAPTVEPSPLAPSPAPSPVLAMAFTTPVPPAADAPWTAIRWRKLASDEPLTLVRSVLRWHGGFIAVGSDGSSTPVWTSPDGAHWEPLPFNTANTFWPGLLIVGMAEVRGGLVALTLLAGAYDCASACPTYSSTLPLMSWTSPDGRSWTPNTGPDIGKPAQWQGAPLLAAGQAGLVVASPASPAHMATSVDGIHWRTVPAEALPSGLPIGDIVGTSAGFTAVGALAVSEGHYRAVALESVDGDTWTGPYPLHLVSASGVILASTGPSWGAAALVAARNGLVAVGTIFATPGEALWWQSANGRDWRSLLNWPPLGPTSCNPGGEGCGLQPDGTLVGDGHRMVALRGGGDAGVWTSFDGLAWSRLPVTGVFPGEQATQAVLLPGGVLLSDGTTTWFGEAQW
jgi:hypothetical protein